MALLEQIVMRTLQPEALETYLNSLPRESLQCSVKDFKLAYHHMKTPVLKNKLLEVLLPGLKMEDAFALDDIILAIRGDTLAEDFFWNHLTSDTLPSSFTGDDLNRVLKRINLPALKLKALAFVLPKLRIGNPMELDEILTSLNADPRLQVYFWTYLSSLSLSPGYTAHELVRVFSREDVTPFKRMFLQIVTPVLQITHPNQLYSILHLLGIDPALQACFLEALKLKNIFFGSFIRQETVWLFKALSTPELKMKLLNFILPTFQFQSSAKLHEILYILNEAGFSAEQLSHFIHQIRPSQCAQMNIMPDEVHYILDVTPKVAQRYLLSILPLHELQSCYRKISDESVLSSTHHTEMKLLQFLDKAYLSPAVSEEAQSYLLSIFPHDIMRRCLEVAHPYRDARFNRNVEKTLISSHAFRRRSSHFFAQFNAPSRREEEVDFTQKELADIQNARVRRRGY